MYRNKLKYFPNLTISERYFKPLQGANGGCEIWCQIYGPSTSRRVAVLATEVSASFKLSPLSCTA